VLQAEMTEVIGASSGERTELRSGYRAGYYSRSLVTRIGKLELRIPRDREGGSPPSCSIATSARRRRWCRPWPRCTCRACQPARSCENSACSSAAFAMAAPDAVLSKMHQQSAPTGHSVNCATRSLSQAES